MPPLSCWAIKGKYRVTSQGRLHNGDLVELFNGAQEHEQEISWKIAVLIHFISLFKWHGRVTYIYIYTYINFKVITVGNQQKVGQFFAESILVGNCLKWHIYEFIQFQRHLIAPAPLTSILQEFWVSFQQPCYLWFYAKEMQISQNS